MRVRTRPPVPVLLVAGAVFFAGCGSDGGSSAGDVEAFCAEFAESSANEVDMDEDFEAGMAEMERIAELAPSSIRGDIESLMDVFQQLDDLEQSPTGDDEADFAAFMALAFSPEVIEASENLERFAVDECGLDPDELNGDDSINVTDLDDGSEDASDVGSDEPVGPMVSEAAEGVDDPLFDPFFDDEVDLGVASYEGAQYFLDVNYTDAPWRTSLGSWSFFGVGAPELEVGGLDLSESDAAEVCAALVEYLAQFGDGGTVTVGAYTQDDDGFFGATEPIVTAVDGDGC